VTSPLVAFALVLFHLPKSYLCLRTIEAILQHCI
jgi:hypothetical protein